MMDTGLAAETEGLRVAGVTEGQVERFEEAYRRLRDPVFHYVRRFAPDDDEAAELTARTPADAAEMAAEKGYTIRWQIEDRAATEASDDDATRFSDEPPARGTIEGGSVIEESRIQMVVMIDDPLTPGSEC